MHVNDSLIEAVLIQEIKIKCLYIDNIKFTPKFVMLKYNIN